jgi:hypothetical protein
VPTDSHENVKIKVALYDHTRQGKSNQWHKVKSQQQSVNTEAGPVTAKKGNHGENRSTGRGQKQKHRGKTKGREVGKDMSTASGSADHSKHGTPDKEKNTRAISRITRDEKPIAT